MALRLFVEAEDFLDKKLEFITEQSETGGKDKDYYIYGPTVQAGIKNRNGRNYPYDLMVPVIEKYVRDRMTNGNRAYGELGHPDGPDINLERVSHYMKELKWAGKNCMGKSKVILGNAPGRIVKTFIDENLLLGSSTRGLGSLSESANQDGSKNVTSYEMIASDIVADPSAPQGFIRGILENKQYIMNDNGIILECYNVLEESVSVLPKDSELKKLLYIDAIETFLKNLDGRNYK